MKRFVHVQDERMMDVRRTQAQPRVQEPLDPRKLSGL
jgi:hypothetical protein